MPLKWHVKMSAFEAPPRTLPNVPASCSDQRRSDCRRRLAPPPPICYRSTVQGPGFYMISSAARAVFALSVLALAFTALPAPASRAADDADKPKGAAVTVLTAAKSCFDDTVEVSGFVLAREETAVRPERPGMKVTEVLAEAGDTVPAGQNLAILNLPEGGTT